jgi:hypothetical protein
MRDPEDADASAIGFAQAPHGLNQSTMSQAHRTLVLSGGPGYALALGATGQMELPAAIATIGPERQTGAFGRR